MHPDAVLRVEENRFKVAETETATRCVYERMDSVVGNSSVNSTMRDGGNSSFNSTMDSVIGNSSVHSTMGDGGNSSVTSTMENVVWNSFLNSTMGNGGNSSFNSTMDSVIGNSFLNSTAGNVVGNSYWYAYVPISCTSVIINLFVVIVIPSRGLTTAEVPRVFIANQMVSNTVASIVNCVCWVVGDSFTVPANVFGDVVCSVWLSRVFLWSAVQTSIVNVILMTVERYLSVVHPIWSRQYMSRPTALGMAAFAWAFGILTEFPSFAATGRDASRCVYLALGDDVERAWGVVLLLSFFVLPFFGLLFWNIRIVQALRTSQHGTGRKRRHSARQQVTSHLSLATQVVAVAYIVCFAPNSILVCLYKIGAVTTNYSSLCYEVTRLLVNLFFVFNPLLYIVTIRPLREELRKLFRSSKQQQPVSVSSAHTLQTASEEIELGEAVQRAP